MINWSAEGRVALVTGAARGLGLGAAEALSQAGAAVVLCDVDLAQAETEAARLRAGGAKALALGNDITKLSEIEQMVAKTVETFGRVDILVNNAGICPRI